PGDGAAGAIYDLVAPGTDTTLGGTENYLPNFPYLGVPHSGYNAPSVASCAICRHPRTPMPRSSARLVRASLLCSSMWGRGWVLGSSTPNFGSMEPSLL